MAFSTYPSESTPLTSPSSYQSGSSIASSDDSKDALNTKYDEFEDEDKLARKLLACNGNVELESIVMRRSLDISFHAPKGGRVSQLNKSKSRRSLKEDQSLFQKMFTMISLALLGLLTIFVLLQVSSLIVGPPSQPVGPYQLVEAQVSKFKCDITRVMRLGVKSIILSTLPIHNIQRREIIFSISMISTLERILQDQRVMSTMSVGTKQLNWALQM